MLTIDSKRAPKPPTTKETQLLQCVQRYFPESKWHVNCFYRELKSSSTGYSLQLDLYCPDLKLAFEGNGESHRNYEVFKAFCPEKNSYEKFVQYQANSKEKERGCKHHGISLFSIDYGRDIKMTMEQQVQRAVTIFLQQEKDPNFDLPEMLNDIGTVLAIGLFALVFVYCVFELNNFLFD